MSKRRVFVVLMGFRSGDTREMVFPRPSLAGRYAMQIALLPTVAWFRCFPRAVRPEVGRN